MSLKSCLQTQASSIGGAKEISVAKKQAERVYIHLLIARGGVQ
jgi:hypothetical protein